LKNGGSPRTIGPQIVISIPEEAYEPHRSFCKTQFKLGRNAMPRHLAANDEHGGEVDRSVRPIYLDYNATTPHAPEVVDAMGPFLEIQFGNPSSSHWYGLETRKAVDEARRQVAALLNCQPEVLAEAVELKPEDRPAFLDRQYPSPSVPTLLVCLGFKYL
jgi:hypothetical protein